MNKFTVKRRNELDGWNVYRNDVAIDSGYFTKQSALEAAKAHREFDKKLRNR